jgi:hypothetical protein
MTARSAAAPGFCEWFSGAGGRSVEDLLFPLALDSGTGVVAKDIPGKTERLVEHFFITLQQDLHEWISLGTTKTGMVYRLKGHAVERHE